jgi:hypothetical protein
MIGAGAWLGSLPAALAPQRAVLESFLATSRGDERIRVLVVGCSLGRGVADALSDIDALIGVRPDNWEMALAASRRWVTDAGPIIDMNQSVQPATTGGGREYQHTYALYANGVELDLSVSRAGGDWSRRADWIVLHDPDSLVPTTVTESTPAVDDVRRWGYAVLIRLNAVVKYLSRGALWEAHSCLELARADSWRVYAVGEHVRDAQYGVTAVFDDPRQPVPATMRRTVASLDPRSLTVAARACCDLVVDSWAVGSTTTLTPL